MKVTLIDYRIEAISAGLSTSLVQTSKVSLVPCLLPVSMSMINKSHLGKDALGEVTVLVAPKDGDMSSEKRPNVFGTPHTPLRLIVPFQASDSRTRIFMFLWLIQMVFHFPCARPRPAGNGADMDILIASGKAYLEAINSIHTFKPE
jgi:hypothetical protein